MRRWIRNSSLTAAAAVLATAGVALTQNAHAAYPDQVMATYNMQGGSAFDVSKWSTDIQQLMANTDILALQEAGPQAPGDVVGTDDNVVHKTWNVGTSTRPNILHTYFLDTDTTGHRVTLAMVTKQPADDVYWIESAFDTSRDSFGLVFGDSVYFDIHALSSSGGSDVPRMLDNYAAVAAAFSKKWAVMGDFNREPTTLSAPAGGQIIHPGAATQKSGGELDYMITSSTEPQPVTATLSAGLSSDHFPVRFDP